MNREEAIKYAEAMKAKTQEKIERFRIRNAHAPEVYYSDLAFLSAAISALREQEERRWIPVAERLPNTGDVVLTFSNKDGVNIGKYVGYGAFVVRKWDLQSKPARTTHWMPLPEPPKGE